MCSRWSQPSDPSFRRHDSSSRELRNSPLLGKSGALLISNDLAFSHPIFFTKDCKVRVRTGDTKRQSAAIVTRVPVWNGGPVCPWLAAPLRTRAVPHQARFTSAVLTRRSATRKRTRLREEQVALPSGRCRVGPPWWGCSPLGTSPLAEFPKPVGGLRQTWATVLRSVPAGRRP